MGRPHLSSHTFSATHAYENTQRLASSLISPHQMNPHFLSFLLTQPTLFGGIAAWVE